MISGLKTIVLAILAGWIAGCGMPIELNVEYIPTTETIVITEQARPAQKQRKPKKKPKTTYTILLKTFSQPRHNKIARQWKASLTNHLRWKKLYIISDSNMNVSRLFWGEFRNQDAAARSLKKAHKHRTSKGGAPFMNADIMITPGTDDGRGRWDIKKNSGVYSLLVADFENSPENKYFSRREDSIAYCLELREQGYEAWYYHGPATSSVTIGAFDRFAVKMELVKTRNPRGGRPFTKENRTIVDLEARQLLRKFPRLLWNLRPVTNVKRAVDGRAIRKHSPTPYMIVVPGKEDYVPKPKRWSRPRRRNR